MKTARYRLPVVLAMVLSTSLLCAAQTRTAVVDMTRLIKAHPDAQAADELLQKQLEDFQLEQQEMLAQGEAIKTAYIALREEAGNSALSEEGRALKVKDLEQKRAELEGFEKTFVDTMRLRRKQLTDQEARLRRRIVEKIRETVAAYAAEKGLALVLDLAGAGISGVEPVVYFEKTMDVTDDLLKTIGTAVQE